MVSGVCGVACGFGRFGGWRLGRGGMLSELTILIVLWILFLTWWVLMVV